MAISHHIIRLLADERIADLHREAATGTSKPSLTLKRLRRARRARIRRAGLALVTRSDR
jgi:hypothetical protein